MMVFLRRLWELVKPYRVRLYMGVVLGIIAGLFDPLMLLNILFVLSVIFPSAGSSMMESKLHDAPEFVRNWIHDAQTALANGLQSHQSAVVLLLATIPAVMFLRGLFSYLNIYFLQWSAVRAVNDLRVRLFSHLLNLSATFFSQSRSGELVSRIMSDTGALQVVLSNVVADIVKGPATIIVVFVLMMQLDRQLTFVSLLVLPICIVPVVIYSRKLRQSSKAIQTHTAELTEVMSETFSAQRVVKAYNLEGISAERFRHTTQNFIGQFMRLVRSYNTPGPLVEFAGSLGIALVIWFVFAKRTTGQRDPSDLFKFIGYIIIVYKPLKNLLNVHNSFQQARAATERVFQLLEIKNSIVEPAQPRLLKADSSEVHFDHVEFSYEEKRVLQGIDLRIQPGQLVALVGQSGSGKTTLANLLLRFYDPQKGAVRIGGTDIREFATRDLRNHIAVVAQENILFNDTIRRNIELGRPGATEAEIIAAAQHAHAHEFILEKPQGYDTVIGEKGVMLSGGQRQRLAIARAVLRDAPILILDEATSALDTESERAVQAALDELMQGKTTLCIAHRLSTIHHADIIVVLDQGRIIETGKHEELIQRGGTYQKLYEMQFRG